jgi:small nuclear ribonucleoprotein (snRNP)-like protein
MEMTIRPTTPALPDWSVSPRSVERCLDQSNRFDRQMNILLTCVSLQNGRSDLFSVSFRSMNESIHESDEIERCDRTIRIDEIADLTIRTVASIKTTKIKNSS